MRIIIAIALIIIAMSQYPNFKSGLQQIGNDIMWLVADRPAVPR